MIFAKSNIRISLSLSPGEPLINDDRLWHVKTLKILSAVNPRTYVHRICNSPSTSTLMDNYLQLLFLHSSPVGLVITRYLETLVVVSIILEIITLLFLVTWIPLWIILALIEYPLIPKLFMCFTMVFEILFDPPKILNSLLLCNTCLLALWMLSIGNIR